MARIAIKQQLQRLVLKVDGSISAPFARASDQHGLLDTIPAMAVESMEPKRRATCHSHRFIQTLRSWAIKAIWPLDTLLIYACRMDFRKAFLLLKGSTMDRARIGCSMSRNWAAAILVGGIVATIGLPVEAAGLTGADTKGDVTIKLVSCCKTTYFGPAVEAWNASHPHVKVEQEVIPFAQLNDILESRLRTRDTTFDVFILDPPRTAAFATKHYALDLTPYLQKDAQGTLNPESVVATSFEGKIYAAPVFNSTQILIYNRSLLAQAGVAAPSIDPDKRTTWEQVVKDAEQVKQKTGTPTGIVFSQGQGYYQLQPIIMSAGGGPGLAGPENLTPEVNTAPWKKAMTWFGDLFRNGLSPRGVPFTQMDPIFTSGKSPFIATSSDRVREFENQKLNFGVAAFPKFADGKAYTACDSFALALNPYSKLQTQALEFVKWVALTKEGGEAAAAQSPNVPANLLVRDRISNEMEKAGSGLEGLTKLISYETSTTCAHRPQSVGFIQFETAFNQADADVVSGTPASAALDKMQTQLEADFERLR